MLVFAAVTFDWGTITLKDLVYALMALGALVAGYRKYWCWYYQLEDCRATYERLLQQQRDDFTKQMEIERLRGDEFKDLVLEGRALVRTSVEATRAALRPAS